VAAGLEGEWGAAWGGVFEVRGERCSGGWLERGGGFGGLFGVPRGLSAQAGAPVATERKKNASVREQGLVVVLWFCY
jgi:hypothetical protein